MSFSHRAQYIGLNIGLTLVLAAMSPSASAVGDPVAGHDLTYTCSGCHGIEQYKNAYPQYNVPKISGQNYEYLVAALKAYKTGERTHPTMQAQATSFSDADIENIATFLSTHSEAK